jgi:hypothetical protein
MNTLTSKRYLSLSLVLMLCCVCALVLTNTVSSEGPKSLGFGGSKQAVRIFDIGQGPHAFNFELGRETKTQYVGAASIRMLAEQQQLQPRTMVSDDFNGDGMGDLVIGYASSNGGVLGLRQGNLQAIAPTDPEILDGVSKGRFPAPFLNDVSLDSCPEVPDFLQVGDFDSDGYSDVIAAARGGQRVYLFSGDGHGNLGEPKAFEVAGSITSMQAGREEPGKFTSLAVGLLAPGGASVSIYREGGDGLAVVPANYPMPSEVSVLTYGDLNRDGIPDVAAAAGNEVTVVYQSENLPAPLATEVQPPDRTTFPFSVRGLAVGNFVFDRGYQMELALLTDDGTIHLADKGQPDRRAYSADEIEFIRKERAAWHKGEQDMDSLVRKMNGLVRLSARNTSQAAWNITETINAGAAPPFTGAPGILKAGKMSGLALDDLMVASAADNSVQIVKNKEDVIGKLKVKNAEALAQTTSIKVEGAPLAAVSTRLSINGLPGLVVLHEGQVEPTVNINSPDAVFAVNTTLDQIETNPGNAACQSASGCSLRAAITQSNWVGGSNSITLPNGTYTLTLGPWDDEFNTFGASMDSGDLDIIDLSACCGGSALLTAVTINGGGRDTTIVQMGTLVPGSGGISKDRVLESNNFVVPQHGTSLTLNNLTVQNGNAPRTPAPDNYNTKGGGIQFDGFDSPSNSNLGVLTVTNCKFTANTSAGQGGGIFALFGGLTVQTTSIVSSNTTTFAAGGGIQHSGGNVITTTLNINNSTIGGPLLADGNTAGDASFGSGGGIDSVGANAFNITNGSVIRNNTAGIQSGGNGGGGVHIGNSKNIVFSNSTISENKCKHNGGGIWVSARDAVTNAASTITLTTMNVNTNQADSDNTLVGDGGGLFTFFGNATVQTNSHIDGNSANNGGGIFTGWTGIAADPTPGLTVQTGSTIGQAGAGNGNSAKNNGGSICISSAGSIFGTINLNSLTFTNNTANSDNLGGGDGGAIFVSAGNLTSLNNCTIDSNVANAGTGDGIRQTGGTITGAGTLNVNGGDSISITGGTFTSTPSTLNLTGNLLNSGGTFTHNSGTVVCNGSSAQTIGGTTPMTFNNLTINNAAGVNLGNNETVAGALTLTSGALAVGSNTLTLNGAVSATAGSLTSNVNGTVNYNQSSGGQNILAANYGNLTFSNFAKVLPNGGTVQIRGTFTTGAGGGHTLTGSTVEFNGASLQTLPSTFTTYNNLTLNNAAGVNGFSGLTVQGLLRVQAGTFTSSSTYHDVQIDNGATLAGVPTTTINVNGNWTNNGTFTANSNTVNFNGGSAQSLGGTNPTTFSALTINNATGVNLGNNVTVGAALTLTNGALAVGTNTLTLNAGVSPTAGSITSADTGTVNYNQGSNGQSVLAFNYGNLTFSNFNKTLASTGTIGIAGIFTPGTGAAHTITGSTINFNGVGAQTIPAFTYQNLTSSNVGARTLANSGIIKIAGTFTPGANAYTITGSTVEYNGTSAQALPPAFTTYNNLNLNNPAGTTGFVGLTVNGLIEVKAGTFTSSSNYNNVQIDSGATLAATAASTINVSGNWTNNGGTFTPNTSTVNLNGSGAQAIGGTGTTTFNNLTVSNATAISMNNDNTVNGVLALTNADINVAATKTLTQPLAGSSTGTFDVNGRVQRTGFVSGGGALSFGNPFNTIQVTAGAAPANIVVDLVRSVPTGPQGFPTAVQRTYTITPSAGGFTGTLRLHYRDSELNGNVEGPDFIFRRFNGTGWAPVLPTSSDFVNNWLQATGVTTFSPWTMNSTNAPTATSGVITGQILDDQGNPVEGAVVRLSGTQNRKFITDAIGVYRFENVETNGFYTVTPSRANYSFNPATRSFSQVGQTTEATFSATLASSGFVNPLDTPEYFVRQHYLDFLGREPDEAGFNFWSDQINECGADTNCSSRRRENVSAAYFLSIEFQKTGGLVDKVYRASFGTQPAFAQFMPDARIVGQGVEVGKEGWEALLQANKEAFVNAFVNRPAFLAVYGSMGNSQFVDTLISHTGVNFTAAERDALVSRLVNGTQTRADTLRSIAENGRFVDAKFNETFVMMEYYGYLRRDYDASGYAFWLNKLNEFNGNFEQAEMVKAFIVSGEYRDRFPR